MRLFSCAAWLTAFSAISLSAAEFYVSPKGSDQATGSAEAPFASLVRARDEIRKLKQNGELKEAVTVWISGGTYESRGIFTLEAQDSGTSGFPVTYQALKGEKPLFIGAPKVEGFVKHEGEILKADVSKLGLDGITIRQLLFDGERQPLARFPNVDAKDPLYGGWAFVDEMPEGKGDGHQWKRECYVKASDVRKWAHPEEIEMNIFAQYGWWNWIMPVASLDPETRKLTLAKDCGYDLHPNNRYFLQNALEELDAPGEWYLDKRTKTVYFWPPQPLDGKEVRIPILPTFVKMSAGTKFVTLQGLSFTGCNANAVQLENTSNCIIAACTLSHVGAWAGSAISIQGGTFNRAIGNDISYTGNSGINVSGGDRITLTPANNRVENNHIHHVGVIQKNGPGVGLHGVGNTVAHNLIHHCPRMAIQFSGNNLVIEYNHMHHTVLETQDGGAVYTGGRDWIGSRGSILRYNFIHDTVGVGQEKEGLKTPWFTWGIYMDDNAGGLDIVGNIVARSARAGIHLHNGRDHLIENNIFVDGGERQWEFNGWSKEHRFFESHYPTMQKGWDSVQGQPAWEHMRNMDLNPKDAFRSDGTMMSGNIAERNIIFWNDASIRYMDLRNCTSTYNTVDHNLIWNGGKLINTAVAKVGPNIGEEILKTSELFKATAEGKTPKGWGWNHKPRPELSMVMQDGALLVDAAKSEDPKNPHSTFHAPNVPLKAGAAYRAKLKIKGTEPLMNARFAFGVYAAGGGYWQTNVVATKVTPEWQEVEVVGNIPKETDPKWKPWMKEFWLRIDVPEEKGQVFIKEVTLFEADPMDSWKAWQADGWDEKSLVADPLFEDAAKDDYRLKKNSPAWKLGFKQIPVEKIGLYEDELRASWPVK